VNNIPSLPCQKLLDGICHYTRRLHKREGKVIRESRDSVAYQVNASIFLYAGRRIRVHGSAQHPDTVTCPSHAQGQIQGYAVSASGQILKESVDCNQISQRSSFPAPNSYPIAGRCGRPTRRSCRVDFHGNSHWRKRNITRKNSPAVMHPTNTGPAAAPDPRTNDNIAPTYAVISSRPRRGSTPAERHQKPATAAPSAYIPAITPGQPRFQNSSPAAGRSAPGQPARGCPRPTRWRPGGTHSSRSW